MRGVLILNVGSPETKDKEKVKQFIGEMLSDPLVLTVSCKFRDILAKKIIAPCRASRSAAKYSLIWDNEHNTPPLVYHSQMLANKIKEETGLCVEIAMRYGNPQIPDALQRLEACCPALHEVVVVPMFPQYAESSYQTAIDAVGQYFFKQPYPFKLKILEPFYNDMAYIQALSASLKPFVTKPYDRLIFSFHSLPLSHEQRARKKGKQFDYVYQIKESIRLVSKELGIDPKKNRVVYSSAMGKKWLEPGLNSAMKTMPGEGVKKVIVVCPGFPADNLETLYDVNIKAKEIFLENGGEEFSFVPCLDSESYWVNAVIKMVTRKI
ncbi:ferrochelatase [Viscerimonas tarda]